MSENQAIRVDRPGGSYQSEPVSVYDRDLGKTVVVRLKSVPTELAYKLPEDLTFDLFDFISDEFSDQLEKIKEKHGADVAKKAHSRTYDIRAIAFSNSDITEDLTAKFQEEINEIISHFETLIKAHLVDYAIDKQKKIKAVALEKAAKMHKVLDDVIALGEEAIPNDSDEEPS